MKVSLKSDIWGLGIILYQIVYKNLPFASVPGGKTAKIKALTDPTRPVEFGEIADKQLLDTMKKCLEKDPSKRPTTGELRFVSLSSPARGAQDSVGEMEQILMERPSWPPCEQRR